MHTLTRFRFGRIAKTLLVTTIAAMSGTRAVQGASLFLTERFTNGTAPGWNLAGNAHLTGTGTIDQAGSGWLRLTSATYNQAGFAYNNTPIPSGYGIDIRFQYATWGGTGADGFALVLFDGSLSPDRAGAYGGSLGYAQRSGVAGLPGAILGVGFDEWGNYVNGYEGRTGSITAQVPNTITVRGPGDGTANYRTSTNILNYNYLTSYTAVDPTLLQISQSSTRPIQAADYRDAEVIIDTSLIPSGQLPITVKIKKGTSDQQTVVSYDAYAEVLAYFGNDASKIPSTLKYGFTASTGAATNYHEIRGLQVISVEDAPGYEVLPDDYVYSPVSDIPEPGTMFLTGFTLLGGGWLMQRRRAGKFPL